MQSENGANATPERKQKRSPSYPAIDLKNAIDRARTLYNVERENWANIDIILKHWGFIARSGHALVVLAALLKFGLLEDEGSGTTRKAKLSKLALHIVRDTRPESVEREGYIKEAALKPTIHADLWKEFNGSFPSDDNLKHTLKIEKDFSDGGAEDFLNEFKATLAYSKLGKSAGMSYIPIDNGTDSPVDYPQEKQDDPPLPVRPQIIPTAIKKGNMQSFPLPLRGGVIATLTADFPMTSQDWNQMMRVLEVLKPGLVQESDEQKTE